MKLLGIDFGTTRTVVAAADRGNYPVISFQGDGEEIREWYPSIVATNGEEMAWGFEAEHKIGEPGWSILRSFKRQLGEIGPNDEVMIGNRRVGAMELLTGFLSRLRRDLLTRSNLGIKPREKMAAVISVPANANSNQRFMTIEAFRRAGFEIRGMMNEPSAAGMEYAHLLSQSGSSPKREMLVVYDLGGGTFDSSVIRLASRDHEVLSSEGIARLGGDNFDIILLDLAMREAGIDTVTDEALARLLEECRYRKESLHPNSRRVTIDLGLGIEGAGEVSIPVSRFYDECQPLIESTIEAMEQVLSESARDAGFDLHEAAAVYLVGGSSDLPLVSRLLREKYGRQIKRSPYPHAATAIGLAIAADTENGYRMRERFTRHFGVWRERNDGQTIGFDPIFEKETPLPSSGEEPLVRTRRYQPTHNIGHFRYLECSRLDEYSQPQGDIAPWDEVFFPFDPELHPESSRVSQLKNRQIERGGGYRNLIEETYRCDASGTIEVEIADLTNGYRQVCRLRR